MLHHACSVWYHSRVDMNGSSFWQAPVGERVISPSCQPGTHPAGPLSHLDAPSSRCGSGLFRTLNVVIYKTKPCHMEY